MVAYKTMVVVGFTDAQETTREVAYRLATGLETDGSNIADVLAARDDLIIALNVLTWDHIEFARIEVTDIGAGLSANVAANNQVYAFSRTTLSGGDKGFFELPAWDDATFDADSNHLLSAAYNTAAAAVALLTLDPETGQTWTVDFSQSRARKSRAKVIG